MNPRLISGLVVGASLLAGGAATSAPFIATFEGHSDMHGGALWRNDRPNNNDQRGAGLEHQKVIRVGNNILVVGTGSYTDVTPLIPGAGLSSAQAGVLPPKDAGADGIGSQAQGKRIQGLCTSYKLDPIMGLVKTNMSYFTNNDSPDWQNAHKLAGASIDGGTAALVTYGYDPNGNRTRVYARVLGPNCELLSPQQQQFADNNDDYGGVNMATELALDAAGTSRACGTFIGNGNGEDDGHAFCVTAKKTGTGANTYTVTPDFEINTEPNEERTRAEVSMTSIPGHMLACWAAGNNQPPDQGLRCGLINTAPGIAENQRLVWRQYVARREGNIMYSTPTVTSIQTPDGKSTDKFMLSYVRVDVTNRNGRYKGRTEIYSLPLQITTTGFTKLDEPRKGLFGLSDGAHPGATAGVYGVDKRPVSFLWSGNVTDGGPGTVKIVGITADNKLEPVRALNWAAGTSGGYMSLWYGNNPKPRRVARTRSRPSSSTTSATASPVVTSPTSRRSSWPPTSTRSRTRVRTTAARSCRAPRRAPRTAAAVARTPSASRSSRLPPTRPRPARTRTRATRTRPTRPTPRVTSTTTRVRRSAAARRPVRATSAPCSSSVSASRSSAAAAASLPRRPNDKRKPSNMRNQMLLAAVASALIGCVGGIDPAQPDPDPEPDPTATPKDQFNSKVMPLMAACQGCHVGPSSSPTNPFLGETLSSQEGYYAALEKDRAVNGGWVPTAATILTKGPHEGRAWTSAEAETITAWLTAEQLVRGVDTTPVPPPNPNTSARGAMMQWAQCLSVSLAEYEATQAYTVANMQSENGQCLACHYAGAAGLVLLNNGQREKMLGHWQEEVFLQGVFTARIQPTTPPTYKMEAAETKFCNKGLEKNNNQGTHPEFNCNQNGMTRLKNFATQIQAKIDAGQCGTPAAFREPQPL